MDQTTTETQAPATTPAPLPLTEALRRRPGFKEGVPIVLGDGAAWHFPKPKLRFIPAADDQGELHLKSDGFTLGREIDPYLDRVMEADTDVEIIEAAMMMGYYALRQNYLIELGELGKLLFYIHDDDNLEMWKQLVGFVRGDAQEGPKVSAVGSASPSEPTASTSTI